MKIVKLEDEVLALRNKIMRPKTLPPEQAWQVLEIHALDTRGIKDLRSPEGQEYLAVLEQHPGMRALLAYMTGRNP